MLRTQYVCNITFISCESGLRLREVVVNRRSFNLHSSDLECTCIFLVKLEIIDLIVIHLFAIDLLEFTQLLRSGQFRSYFLQIDSVSFGFALRHPKKKKEKIFQILHSNALLEFNPLRSFCNVHHKRLKFHHVPIQHEIKQITLA